MLRDVTPREQFVEGMKTSMAAHGWDNYEPVKRLTTGVYQMTMWNPEFFFEEKLKDHMSSLEDTDEAEKCEQWTPENRMGKILEFWEKRTEDLHQRYLKDFGKDYPTLDSYAFYGVCDNYQQILDRFPHIEAWETPLVIFLVEVVKNPSSEGGGWRWHKWGEYIGTQTPTSEYLDDEPLIERVFTFHVYEIQE